MEELYYADRALLRHLLQAHPDWPVRALADHIGRSLGWTKKWVKRLRAASWDDERVLWSRSRARLHPPASVDSRVVERILAIRDGPPEHVQRTPGPKAILYYLQRDPDLAALSVPLPRSTRTIWRILTQYGRIVQRHRPEHMPLERPAPLTTWHLDFKDAATVPGDPPGKRQHVVEVLNTVDVGTSVLVDAQVDEDLTAQTSVLAAAQLLREHGLPDTVTFDRDPRFVGSWSTRDFPSPFMRFWSCVGVATTICPPHRPDKNAFVERYHRSYNHECLQVTRPGTAEEVRAVTAVYAQHDNEERPNQALSCGNRPPRVAFPVLPLRPSVPLIVDPDAWLRAIDGRTYVRKVKDGGSVTVDDTAYYVGAAVQGRTVALQVVAASGEVAVWHEQREIKRRPIKGLIGQLLPFEHFVDVVAEQARTERGIRLAHPW